MFIVCPVLAARFLLKVSFINWPVFCVLEVCMYLVMFAYVFEEIEATQI